MVFITYIYYTPILTLSTCKWLNRDAKNVGNISIFSLTIFGINKTLTFEMKKAVMWNSYPDTYHMDALKKLKNKEPILNHIIIWSFECSYLKVLRLLVQLWPYDTIVITSD